MDNHSHSWWYNISPLRVTSALLMPLHLFFSIRDIKKSWCRSGDPGSCQFTGTEGIFDSPSVTIADDRVGAFTVNLSKLRMADAGWYWCGVGTQKTAVQVLVTPRPSTSRFCKNILKGKHLFYRLGIEFPIKGFYLTPCEMIISHCKTVNS